MIPRLRHAASCLLVLLGATSAARAQQNPPRLAYALPAGGQQGTTFQVTLGGQFLQNASAVRVSGDGIEVTVGEHTRPMPAMQAMQLREKLQELLKQPRDEEVRKEIVELRTKLFHYERGRNTSPALAETVSLRVAVSPGATPGRRELRLRSPQGLSNPLAFFVGQLPETTEKETLEIAVPPAGNQPQISQPATEMALTLPAVVNGRIKPRLSRPQPGGRPVQQFTPGDADRYRFEARRGRQLVVAASARALIPYLADAVPGWFQAVVTLYDAEGKELAYDDDFRFHPDPVLHYEIPRDGEYVLEVRDALYRGREDFVYRIAVGELPFVTGVFPLGGPAGGQVGLRLTGWNLPSDRLKLDTRGMPPGIHPVSVSRGALRSNEVPFAVEALPEALDKEPNDTPKSAQRLKLPIVVNGRIGSPRDTDVFAFEGRADEEIVAEVHARRLDSPLDSVLRLSDAAGRQLAVNDDHEDKGSGLDTHHADSLLTVRLPASGTYYLRLGDAQQKSGPEYAYRLRVGRPQPGFELRVVPSSINVAAGATVPFAVHALRRDGFAGDIALSLKDAPAGFSLSGALLPAGQNSVRLTLTVPPAQMGEPARVGLVGRAMLGGREVERVAVPADDMMQAFAYRHLVPAHELLVAVRGGGGRRGAAATRFLAIPTVRIPAGGAARVRLQAPPVPGFAGKLELELSEPPEGIALRDESSEQQGVELVLLADAEKVRPGLRGNLIVNLFGERPAGAVKRSPNRARVPLGTLPALPFEIVAP